MLGQLKKNPKDKFLYYILKILFENLSVLVKIFEILYIKYIEKTKFITGGKQHD
ncbi:conserved hypothetical protein [Listeria monocytogenes FSL F2-208]|nr:conserved hypothetical protein [Listeria monocytogenes FSL F2-208]